MPRRGVQLAPGTEIEDDGKDDTQENDDGDGPQEAKRPSDSASGVAATVTGAVAVGDGAAVGSGDGVGEAVGDRRGRGRRAWAWATASTSRSAQAWPWATAWVSPLAPAWPLPQGLGVAVGSGVGVAVGAGVAVDVGAGVGGGPTRNCVWPVTLRSSRSAFLTTPVKVYCPSVVETVTKYVKLESPNRLKRTTCPSSATWLPGRLDLTKVKPVRQRLLHLPEGAVVAGGDGDPELAVGRGPGPLEGAAAALCDCASTTPGGVSSAMAPTMAANASAATAPKEIRINSSSCLLAPCGGLRYYAK